MAAGDSIYKVFTSSKHQCGVSAHHSKGRIILPGLKKRLNSEVSKIALNANQCYVHGNFHMGNVLFNGEKHVILDVATIGKLLLSRI